jgi:hypothetical protein
MTKKEIFLERVIKAGIGVKVPMGDLQNLFTDVKFEDYSDSYGFIWIATKEENRYMFFTTYGKTNNTVKYFKTLPGCKRNFIKRFIHLFNN